jgi:hypothetical protein
MNRHARAQAFWKYQPDPAVGEQGDKELARFLPVLDAALADKSAASPGQGIGRNDKPPVPGKAG